MTLQLDVDPAVLGARPVELCCIHRSIKCHFGRVQHDVQTAETRFLEMELSLVGIEFALGDLLRRRVIAVGLRYRMIVPQNTVSMEDFIQQ